MSCCSYWIIAAALSCYFSVIFSRSGFSNSTVSSIIVCKHWYVITDLISSLVQIYKPNISCEISKNEQKLKKKWKEKLLFFFIFSNWAKGDTLTLLHHYLVIQFANLAVKTGGTHHTDITIVRLICFTKLRHAKIRAKISLGLSLIQFLTFHQLTLDLIITPKLLLNLALNEGKKKSISKPHWLSYQI